VIRQPDETGQTGLRDLEAAATDRVLTRSAETPIGNP
jgi:hypothetical protein